MESNPGTAYRMLGYCLSQLCWAAAHIGALSLAMVGTTVQSANIFAGTLIIWGLCFYYQERNQIRWILRQSPARQLRLQELMQEVRSASTQLVWILLLVLVVLVPIYAIIPGWIWGLLVVGELMAPLVAVVFMIRLSVDEAIRMYRSVLALFPLSVVSTTLMQFYDRLGSEGDE